MNAWPGSWLRIEASQLTKSLLNWRNTYGSGRSSRCLPMTLQQLL